MTARPRRGGTGPQPARSRREAATPEPDQPDHRDAAAGPAGVGTGRAPRSDAARNAARLVAVARELFAERGPEVPLDEVARRAGIGNATLYRHFPTRGDLVVAVYADEVAALCRRGAELAGDVAAADDADAEMAADHGTAGNQKAKNGTAAHKTAKNDTARNKAAQGSAAGAALDAWLGDFVEHVFAKRPLAVAVTDRPDERRSRLFAGWHAELTAVAERLIGRATAAGAVRPGLDAADLLALVSAAALAARDAGHARQLLGLIRDGFAVDLISTESSK